MKSIRVSDGAWEKLRDYSYEWRVTKIEVVDEVLKEYERYQKEPAPKRRK